MRYHETQIQQHQAARLLNHDYSLTRKNILGDGLKLCRRAKAFNTADPTTAYIKVERKNNRLTAKMQDVVYCGNAHLCPFCAGAKAAHMRDWITEMLIPACQQRGLVFGLLLFWGGVAVGTQATLNSQAHEAQIKTQAVEDYKKSVEVKQ